MFRNTLYAMATLAVVATATGAEWVSDFDTAKQQAAAEGKALLMNFTGSDWCSHCRRIKYAVLDTPEFAVMVEGKYVLLEVDIPRRAYVDAEVLEKRKDLCRTYSVTGFPTFVMTDARGEVLGGFTGGQMDVEGMRLCLADALQMREALQAARSLHGVQRAEALAAIYRVYPKQFAQFAAALRVEIAEHDPQDTTGMQKQAAADALLQALSAELAQYPRHDYQNKARVYDSYLAQASPAAAEKIMERKRAEVIFPCLNIMLFNADNLQDIQAAREYILREAQTCYPESIRAEMIRALEQEFQDPEALLRKVKKH